MKMTLQDLETALMLGGWKIDVHIKDVETFWIGPDVGAHIRVGPAYGRDTQGKGRVGTYAYNIGATPMNVYSYESFFHLVFGGVWDVTTEEPWLDHLRAP